jgi:hypothetical protein
VGSHRHQLGECAKPRIPLLECGLSGAIRDTRADLQQEMRAAWGPPHLLLFTETPADHLVHGRLHKTGIDPFALAVALAIVRNKALIAVRRIVGGAGSLTDGLSYFYMYLR